MTPAEVPELTVNLTSLALPPEVQIGLLVTLPRPSGDVAVASTNVKAYLNATAGTYTIGADQYKVFNDTIKQAILGAKEFRAPKVDETWSFNVRGVVKQTKALSEEIKDILHVQVTFVDSTPKPGN